MQETSGHMQVPRPETIPSGSLQNHQKETGISEVHIYLKHIYLKEMLPISPPACKASPSGAARADFYIRGVRKHSLGSQGSFHPASKYHDAERTSC